MSKFMVVVTSTLQRDLES